MFLNRFARRTTESSSQRRSTAQIIRRWAFFPLWIWLLVPLPTMATTIGFAPDSQVVPVGDPASVDVVISGLGILGPLSLGAFDLDISFDSSILDFTGIVFGPFLGDPGSFEALTGFDVSVPAVVSLFEVSLLPPAGLDALQPSSFPIATLTFDTLSVGMSPLDITVSALGDGFGDPLVADLASGSISAVPEPSTLLLLCSGLAAVTLRRRYVRRRPLQTGA